MRGVKSYGRKPRGVRWGKVREIDYRIKVGSATWGKMPRRLKHLTSWRRMHQLPGGKKAHMPVRMYGVRHKVRPSSNLRLNGRVSKLAYCRKKSPRKGR